MLALCLLAVTRAAHGATPPSGFQDTIVASGISSPTALAFAPDGRLFITEKASGRVLIVKNGVKLTTPFADVKTLIPVGTPLDTYFERGLLGIAMDPAFAGNGYVYLYYTICKVPHPGGVIGTGTGCDAAFNRVVRVKATGDLVAANSHVVLLDDIGAAGGNHNGGWIGFGPLDGKLYVAVGDNATSTTAQDVGALNGKILRINPTGTVPADNPFVSTPGARDEVWAYGFRNPFRCVFHPNGTLFCTDVGQSTWEEINIVTKGANYGWPTTEGTFVQTAHPGFTNPIYVYPHAGQSAAVVGGEFGVRTNFPGTYGNSFFFGDYAIGTISRLVLDGTGTVVQSVQAFIPDAGVDSITGFVAGPDGSLYYTNYAAGSVHKVTAVVANHSPVAQASATPGQGPPPLTVQLSSTGSGDLDGDPMTFLWSFGDGTPTSTAPNVQHTYGTQGLYTATLTVSDGKAVPGPGTDSVAVTVGDPPTMTITEPVDGSLFRGGDLIPLVGSGSDAEDGPVPTANLHWQVILHHNTHTHPYIDDIPGSPTSFTVTTGGETDPNIWYEVALSATDSIGLTGTASVSIDPVHANMSFATNPSTLQLTLDGQPQSTPAIVTGVVGIQRMLGAPSPQASSGGSMTFRSWADGGAQTHAIITPDVDTTYTATFGASPTTTTTLAASPGTCAGPIVLPAQGGTVLGTTSGTSALSGTCATTSPAPERVYQWTPAVSGTATIQTCSATQTTFDTVLYLRQGTCASGTQVACNDDTTGCASSLDGTSPHRGSRLAPTVVAGQPYFIVVDGFKTAQGSFTLTVTPPGGGTTTTTLPPAGTCAAPIVLPAQGGTVFGTTSGTSALSGTCATGSAPERVYQWTPTKSGIATIQTCSATQTTFDTVLYLRQGTCASGTQVACDDDLTGCASSLDGTNPHRGSYARPAVTAGQTYFIIVDGYGTAKGNFTLTVTPAP